MLPVWGTGGRGRTGLNCRTAGGERRREPDSLEPRRPAAVLENGASGTAPEQLPLSVFAGEESEVL